MRLKLGLAAMLALAATPVLATPDQAIRDALTQLNFDVPVTVIDPGEPASLSRAKVIRKGAGEGVAEWMKGLGL